MFKTKKNHFDHISDQDKIHTISDKLVIAAIGDTGDAIQFTEYISKNLALYKMRNGYELGPKSAAHFTRKNLADYLRSRTPYHVNLFVAGYDEKEGSELHYIDYIANAKSLNYAGHGYGGIFAASIFDRYWHPSMYTSLDLEYDQILNNDFSVRTLLQKSLRPRPTTS